MAPILRASDVLAPVGALATVPRLTYVPFGLGVLIASQINNCKFDHMGSPLLVAITYFMVST